MGILASNASIQAQINRAGEQLDYFEKQLKQAQIQLANPIPNTPGQRAFLQSQIDKARENITAIEAVQVDLEAKLDQQLNAGRTSSAADTTATAQAARSDGANNSAAPAIQKETGPDGRVKEKAAAAPTNADPPKTTANGNVDVGTNAATVTLTTSQGIPGGTSATTPSLVPAPLPPDTIAVERGLAAPNKQNTGGTPGVGAQREDAATFRPTVVNRLDELYAGARNAIKSRDNVLDQFASYTYSLSWYLLDHATYNTLLSSDIKQLNNYNLLAQSGGAALQTKSQSYVETTSAGRNPFFTLDYYLDNFEFDTAVSGTPGSRGAAKLSSLSFTVTEPNGISLISNLSRAVNALYWSKGLATKGTTVNYNEAHYCMVIRFYGYDSNGQLVMPIDNRQGLTDRQAAIEKFIPFNITGIDFKVANKLVEYSIRGAPIDQLTAFSTDRGSIPQNFQFQGRTTRDILAGATQQVSAAQLARESAARADPDTESRNIGQGLGATDFSQPPSKASGAPYRVGTMEATGLCAALNLYWAEEAKGRKGIADVYEIQFLDPILSDAKLVPNSTNVDKVFTGEGTKPLTGAKLDSYRQSMNTAIRVRSCTAGQQIVQFIDEVMRNSSYIFDQQKYEWVNGKWTARGRQSDRPNQVFAWFDISCEAQVIKYDETARCNAYRMIYKVATYQTTLTSEYFDPGAFRGVHKVYNYWFTGQNTQVIQYEQSFNNLWAQTISASGLEQAQNIQNNVNSSLVWRKRFQPASNQTREGAAGNTFEPAANAADMLYTADLAKINLNIIGDPAWIPSPKTPQPGAFVVTPFFADDTINYGAGSPYFEFAWNRPVDYNLETGLMDPGQNNYFADRDNGRAGIAQQSVIYKTTGIKSKFGRGKFTQELTGVWLMDGKQTTTEITKDAIAADAAADDEARRITSGQGADLPRNAGVAKTAEANILNQYRSSPSVQSPGPDITGNTIAGLLPAIPPILTTEVAPAPPPKLGAGGFGSGANNPSLAGISADPQLLSKDA
jgi:hypothetical protein